MPWKIYLFSVKKQLLEHLCDVCFCSCSNRRDTATTLSNLKRIRAQLNFHETLQKIKSRNAHIGVIGLGYVGLPLVSAFIDGGFQVAALI